MVYGRVVPRAAPLPVEVWEAEVRAEYERRLAAASQSHSAVMWCVAAASNKGRSRIPLLHRLGWKMGRATALSCCGCATSWDVCVIGHRCCGPTGWEALGDEGELVSERLFLAAGVWKPHVLRP